MVHHLPARGRLVAVLAALLVAASVAPLGASGQAILQTGSLQLGVRATGDLNVASDVASLGPCSPVSTCSSPSPCLPPLPNTPLSGMGPLGPCDNQVGMRWNGLEAIAGNCRCEGWGVMYWSPTQGLKSGYAQSGLAAPVSNLNVINFGFSPPSQPTSAISVVQMGDLRITHDFHPYPGLMDTFEATVVIQNTGQEVLQDVRYRRVIDWDIEPTPAHEMVANNVAVVFDPPMGPVLPMPPPELLCTSFDPFTSADPAQPFGTLPLASVGWGLGSGAGNKPYATTPGTTPCQGRFPGGGGPQDLGFVFDLSARPYVDPPAVLANGAPTNCFPFLCPPRNSVAPGYPRQAPEAPWLGVMSPGDAYRFQLYYHAGPDVNKVFGDMFSLGLGTELISIAWPAALADQHADVPTTILLPPQVGTINGLNLIPPPAGPLPPAVGVPIVGGLNILPGPLFAQDVVGGIPAVGGTLAGLVPRYQDACAPLSLHDVAALAGTDRPPAEACQSLAVGAPASYPGAFALGYRFDPCAPPDPECTLPPLVVCPERGQLDCHPEAKFTYLQPLPCSNTPAASPPPVQFTDMSTPNANYPTDPMPFATYSWTFGDSPPGSSLAQNPVYQYQAPGTYWVTETVTDAVGFQDVYMLQVEVKSAPPCPGPSGGSQAGSQFGEGAPRDRTGDYVGLDGDVDKDGILDGRDNCPSLENPNQADFDRDGHGDSCDPDGDGDGVADFRDNCELVNNKLQGDLDADGVGDACDEDIDGDSVLNEPDNCVVTVNVEQRNLDGDILGDACDPDRDGDGTANLQDCFPDDKAIVCPEDAAPLEGRNRVRPAAAVSVADVPFMTAAGYAFLLASIAVLLLLAITVARRRRDGE